MTGVQTCALPISLAFALADADRAGRRQVIVDGRCCGAEASQPDRVAAGTGGKRHGAEYHEAYHVGQLLAHNGFILINGGWVHPIAPLYGVTHRAQIS